MDMNRHIENGRQVNCEELREQIPAYVFGLLDDEERLEVEIQLAQCPEVQTELQEYQSLHEAMHHSSEPMEAPSVILENLMMAIQPDLTETAQMPQVTPSNVRRPNFLAFTGLAAALALFILVSTNLYWFTRVQQLETDLAQLAPPSFNPQGNLINFSTSSEAQQVSIEPVDSATVRGLLQWAEGAVGDTWLATFQVSGLTRLDPDQVYQLWFSRPEEAPVSAGIFVVDEDGSGLLFFEITEPIGSFAGLGVSIEPQGGSPAPTGDVVLSGEI